VQITQIRIGTPAEMDNDTVRFSRLFEKTEHSYYAEIIEDAGVYTYSIDGVKVDAEKWEIDRVLANPYMYYFSMALKLHHRVRRKVDPEYYEELKRKNTAAHAEYLSKHNKPVEK